MLLIIRLKWSVRSVLTAELLRAGHYESSKRVGRGCCPVQYRSERDCGIHIHSSTEREKKHGGCRMCSKRFAEVSKRVALKTDSGVEIRSEISRTGETCTGVREAQPGGTSCRAADAVLPERPVKSS
ncbi:hypothetical protein DPX16_10216 [Anabarilius grahami]|uniref:Uncharacterized protein n=1 Tax=Anabarilius grahami TaxID=495550 RepID=A0A3N0Y0I8_ANAGA|nr:hypothetical protein DPX16_10216 [Anabarilius grahami]